LSHISGCFETKNACESWSISRKLLGTERHLHSTLALARTRITNKCKSSLFPLLHTYE
jgi:hypothetical protein